MLPRKELGSQVSPPKEGGDRSPACPDKHKDSRARISAFSQKTLQTTFLQEKGQFLALF